ncbi:MAG: arsenate reductase family protein [Chlorobiaceae bacterium]|nr:arsenate reductase family protein [Chlorobiaceae bacterium]
MAHITFYEKPGCENNRRQKEWLELAGHTLDVVDILSHPWEKEELRAFLGEKTVYECFNPAAPDIKNGRIDPGILSKEEAIDMMVKNPLLIRRPLMKIGVRRIQGFDPAQLRSIIYLEPVKGAESLVQSFKMLDMNSCTLSCSHSSNNT